MVGDPTHPDVLPLYQAELDVDTLDALFRDLAGVPHVKVVVRDAVHTYVREATSQLDLVGARARLDAGKAVQLRYVYEGAEWWDTLTPHDGIVRLVRVRHDRD